MGDPEGLVSIAAWNPGRLDLGRDLIKSKTSPYIEANNRLADVIAAIQAMGTYKFYKLDFAGWADRISGDELEAPHWR